MPNPRPLPISARATSGKRNGVRRAVTRRGAEVLHASRARRPQRIESTGR
jgi:hypothetical protein